MRIMLTNTVFGIFLSTTIGDRCIFNAGFNRIYLQKSNGFSIHSKSKFVYCIGNTQQLIRFIWIQGKMILYTDESQYRISGFLTIAVNKIYFDLERSHLKHACSQTKKNSCPQELQSIELAFRHLMRSLSLSGSIKSVNYLQC